MRIAFQQVSYSYQGKAQEKAASKRRSRGGRKAAASPSAQALGQADWGADPDARWALRDVTFSVEPGEFLGLAGHTGSGKSTLIQHMNGLLHPTEGRVLADGRDLADKRWAQECRGKVGLVFQYPENQLFAPTVSQDVAFGPKNLGLSGRELEERVRRALERVHLSVDDIGGRSPFELSGGQQRRVAFAGVLAMDPQVLVLDEPVAGLDPRARESFLDLIAELHEGGVSVVMASHNMDDLARLSDRILVLNAGSIFSLGTPEEVFADGAPLRRIGLDVPPAQRMAEELRDAGFQLPRPLYDTASLADDLAPQLGGFSLGQPDAEGRERGVRGCAPAAEGKEGPHA